MNICGWSPIRYGGGVTTNIIAVSTYLNSKMGMSIGMRSNSLGSDMLENYYSVSSRIGCVSEEAGFFTSPGSPDYLKYLLRYRDVFESTLYRGRLGVEREPGVTLYRPPEPGEKPFLERSHEDFFFLDVSGENNKAAFEAIEMADFCMVFLPGDFQEAVSCLDAYYRYLGPSFFVINKGKRGSGFPLDEFKKTFDIPSERISMIPYCSSLMSACLRGDVDLMIKREAENPNQNEYIKKIHSISNKLVRINKRFTTK